MPMLENSTVTTVFDGACQLGEGPAWEPDSGCLFWVDILASQLHRKALTSGEHTCWDAPAKSSAVILGQSESVILPALRAVYRFDTTTGRATKVCELEGERRGNRCNDAKCSPAGELWIGTMDDHEEQQTGRLLRLDRNRQVTPVAEGIGISNTLAWDTGRHVFYFADSAQGEIYRYRYDPSTGGISDRELFFAKGAAPGTPDGSAIDVDGNLWNARWGGACVAVISPTGELLGTVPVPAENPTSCAFGGREMTTLFVTSASIGDKKPDAGKVFTINPEQIPAHEPQRTPC